MHRKIMFMSMAAASVMLLSACNQNQTSSNTPDTNNPNATTQTAQNEPQPGSKNETVSAAKDAIAGGVGTLNAELTSSTKGFVENAALSDMYEVQAGQIAAMRAKMPELKKFAQEMVDAHTMTTDQLKAILTKDSPNYAPPAQLDSRHQGLLDDLKGAKDEDFDGRYIAQQINAHNEALILMRGYAKDGDSVDIRTFAAETEPKVQMHLDMIKNIDQNYRARDRQARNSNNKETKTP